MTISIYTVFDSFWASQICKQAIDVNQSYELMSLPAVWYVIRSELLPQGDYYLFRVVVFEAEIFPRSCIRLVFDFAYSYKKASKRLRFRERTHPALRRFALGEERGWQQIINHVRKILDLHATWKKIPIAVSCCTITARSSGFLTRRCKRRHNKKERDDCFERENFVRGSPTVEVAWCNFVTGVTLHVNSPGHEIRIQAFWARDETAMKRR